MAERGGNLVIFFSPAKLSFEGTFDADLLTAG